MQVVIVAEAQTFSFFSVLRHVSKIYLVFKNIGCIAHGNAVAVYELLCDSCILSSLGEIGGYRDSTHYNSELVYVGSGSRPRGPHWSVMRMAGRTVKQTGVWQTTQYRLPSLPSGIYFFEFPWTKVLDDTS